MTEPVSLPGLELSAAEVEAARRRHMLGALVQLRFDADRVERLRCELDNQATVLRAAGASWTNIGLALMISRQAAQQRYGSVTHD